MCFRIGGDEFAVLISGERVEEQYEEGVVRFHKKMEEYNALPDKKLRIRINGCMTIKKR